MSKKHKPQPSSIILKQKEESPEQPKKRVGFDMFVQTFEDDSGGAGPGNYSDPMEAELEMDRLHAQHVSNTNRIKQLWEPNPGANSNGAANTNASARHRYNSNASFKADLPPRFANKEPWNKTRFSPIGQREEDDALQSDTEAVYEPPPFNPAYTQRHFDEPDAESSPYTAYPVDIAPGARASMPLQPNWSTGMAAPLPDGPVSSVENPDPVPFGVPGNVPYLWSSEGYGAPVASSNDPIWTTNQEPIHRPPADPWKNANAPRKHKKEPKMGPDGPVLDIDTSKHPGQDLNQEPDENFPYSMSMLQFPTSPFADLPLSENPILEKFVVRVPEQKKGSHNKDNIYLPEDPDVPVDPSPSRHGYDPRPHTTPLDSQQLQYLESEVERRRLELSERQKRKKKIEHNHAFMYDQLLNKTHATRPLPSADQLKNSILLNVPCEPARHPGMGQVRSSLHSAQYFKFHYVFLSSVAQLHNVVSFMLM